MESAAWAATNAPSPGLSRALQVIQMPCVVARVQPNIRSQGKGAVRQHRATVERIVQRTDAVFHIPQMILGVANLPKQLADATLGTENKTKQKQRSKNSLLNQSCQYLMNYYLNFRLQNFLHGGIEFIKNT